MAVEETIYLNRVNTNTLEHTTSGKPTVWAGVSYMVIDLIALDDGNSDYQFKTNTGGEEDTVDFAVSGELVFLLGDRSVAAGRYRLELTGVDSSSNKTQIIHPDREYVVFQFSNTKTVT